MVTTTSTTDPRYRANSGEGYDGVARLSINGHSGSGALLYDGRALLTAAHLFDGISGRVQVRFDTPSGSSTQEAGRVLIHPDYNSDQGNNDLALVWLEQAPADADRYNLYRDADELGQAFSLVGYGATGSGSSGASSQTGSIVRYRAENRFEAEGDELKTQMGAGMSWSPTPGSQLLADFDDGSAAHDALGRLMGLNDLGLGLAEGLIAQGDSGGPALLGGQILGIATYTASLSRAGVNPDIDQYSNSSFGELAAWQRASHYQQWIDQSLRSQYNEAPTSPAEVIKALAEGDVGTQLVFFLLQFSGVRSQPEAIVSVDYASRDGSAQADSDYIAVSGRLNLYPGENQAVIPVEVIGDTLAEPDETFYLDVFNPVGGSFGPGVVKLTAMRTLLDDDGWLA
ncbi:MAG: trypsin-like serine protease [Gammaproteobacteria bacterium SHHR-1]